MAVNKIYHISMYRYVSVLPGVDYSGYVKFEVYLFHRKAQVGNSEKTITQSSRSTAPFAIPYYDVSYR